MAHGGRRPGAGRKRSNPPLHAQWVRLTEEHCRLLRMWGRGDLAAGLRWLIDQAAPLVRRAGEKDVKKLSASPPEK